MGRERGGITSGIILITIGLIFFAGRQGFGGIGNFWPLILIVAGAARMFSHDEADNGSVIGRRRRCRDQRFGGVSLIMVGVIFLLHQNHILRLSESWPLFIVAAGLGIVLSGIFNRNDPDTTPADPTSGRGGQ